MYLLEEKAVIVTASVMPYGRSELPPAHVGNIVNKGQAKKTTPTLRVQFSLPRILVSLFCEQRTKADPLVQEQSKYHFHFLHHHGPRVSAEHVAKPFRECRFGHPAICFSY